MDGNHRMKPWCPPLKKQWETSVVIRDTQHQRIPKGVVTFNRAR